MCIDRFGDARDLMLANKAFIAAEAYDRMVLDFPGFVTPTGNPQDCKDDIVDVIEAVAENTAFGGNAETFDAAYLYETGAHVSGEEAETVKAFTYARDMCIQVMRNEDVFVFGTHGLTQTKDTSITYVAPELVADRNGDARNLILANKELIAEEAVARMMVKFPNHQYGAGYTSADCVDDVRDLLEAVADNVAYGGNDKTWDAAYSYVKGAHVAGEEAETIYAFEQAKEMAAQAMRNQKILAIGSHGQTQTYGNSVHTWAGGTSTAAVQSGGVDYDVTNATYDPITGVMALTIGTHSLTVGTSVTIAANSLTFTCGQDGNATQHTYPRPYPFYNTAINIDAVDATTITLNVGIANSGFVNVTYDLPDPVIDRNGDARNLIIANKALIAAEAYERMMAENPGYVHQYWIWSTGLY